MGSTNVNFCNFFADEQNAYILGLLAADSYWWSSSIGLSSTEFDLRNKFRLFALKLGFPPKRIKKSVSGNHIYVNSRPLLRAYRSALKEIGKLKDPRIISAYIAGRFDGDGCINGDLKRDCRIVYNEKSEKQEAIIDSMLLKRIGIDKVSIYHYRTSSQWENS